MANITQLAKTFNITREGWLPSRREKEVLLTVLMEREKHVTKRLQVAQLKKHQGLRWTPNANKKDVKHSGPWNPSCLQL